MGVFLVSARLSQEKVWDFDEKFKEYSKQPKSKKLMNSIKIANLIKNRLTTYEGIKIFVFICNTGKNTRIPLFIHAFLNIPWKFF